MKEPITNSRIEDLRWEKMTLIIQQKTLKKKLKAINMKIAEEVESEEFWLDKRH